MGNGRLWLGGQPGLRLASWPGHRGASFRSVLPHALADSVLNPILRALPLDSQPLHVPGCVLPTSAHGNLMVDAIAFAAIVDRLPIQRAGVGLCEVSTLSR